MIPFTRIIGLAAAGALIAGEGRRDLYLEKEGRSQVLHA